MRKGKRFTTGFLGSGAFHILILLFFGISLCLYNAAVPKASDKMVEVSLVSGGSGQSTVGQLSIMQQAQAEQATPVMQALRPDDISEYKTNMQEKMLTATYRNEVQQQKSPANKAVGSANAKGITGDGGSGAGKDVFGNGDFGNNGDGTYTALNSSGISYTILREIEAIYPEEARFIGYGRTVSVEAKILVGLDGSVESIEILNSAPNLGFIEAAKTSLQEMQFAPIYYNGHNIKMYFKKTIYFKP
jgi:TonB family protein